MLGHWTGEQAGGGGGARRWDSQQNVLLVLLEDAGDVLEDIGREQVDAAVDDVAHKGAGLLHIVQDLEQPDDEEGQIKVGTNEIINLNLNVYIYICP